MDRIDQEVLIAFREDLLNPLVIERALLKLQRRLAEQPAASVDRAATLAAEVERLDRESARLSNALAEGAAFSSVLDALRDRERRRAAIAAELAALEQENACSSDSWSDVLPDIRRRLADWRGVLSEETTQARQMLRRLLDGRIIFTPRPDVQGVEFAGDGDLGQVFAGLVLPEALASLMPASWNQIVPWLRQIDGLRAA